MKPLFAVHLCLCLSHQYISGFQLGAFLLLLSRVRFMYRVKVGENLFTEASAPSKKAARQLAAEEAVKELMAEGRLQLNKVRSGATPERRPESTQ